MFMSLGLTLVILLFTFGALIAAGIPVLLGLTAVLATLGLLGPVSQLAPVDEAVMHVVVLIGMAVGSTTACSTSSAPARSVPPGVRRTRPSRPRPRPRVVRS